MKNHISIAVLALSVTLSSPVLASEEPGYQELALRTDRFDSSAMCGKCHIDIHEVWSRSLHAQAFTDPVFLDAFEDASIQTDEKKKLYCLRCHAPTRYYDENGKTPLDVELEGVTCDFCHSIVEVHLDEEVPFTVSLGRKKYGPYEGMQSPVHETQQSPLFEKGKLCGGCHDMQNLQGLPIITTYSEWKDSYYGAVGESACQDCHMPRWIGQTVSPKYKRSKEYINLHSFPGGRSRVQMNEALQLEVLSARKNAGRKILSLGMTNSGTGHYMPTGNPLGKLVLDVSVYDILNKRILHEEHEMGRSFEDSEGNLLTTDLAVLTDASRVARDNRIAPGETREFTVQFTSPGQKFLLEAVVSYEYENTGAPSLSRVERLMYFSDVVEM